MNVNVVIATPSDVDHACRMVAEQIEEGFDPSNLALECVATGGFYFLGKLMEYLPHEVITDTICCKAYTNGQQTSRRLIKLPSEDIAGRDVVIVDDIFDTGSTITSIAEDLDRLCHPKTIRSATLCWKRGENRPTFYGIEVPNEFVFGCGLDDVGGRYRYIDSICYHAE